MRLATIPLPLLALLVSAVRAEGPAPAVKKDIVYAKPGGTELKLDFFRPAGDGPFPLVLCIHGGAWRGGARTDFHVFCSMLAGNGFAAASVQYRLAPAHKFPAQIDDVRAAIAFLRAGAKDFAIDPDRVAVLGGSAGGHLALLAGLSKPAEGVPPIKAVVNIFGPVDFRNYVIPDEGEQALKKHCGKGLDGILEDLLGTTDRKAAVYAEASPITHVAAGNPPVLTLQGTKDILVPDAQARMLHEALKKAGVTEKLMLIEGGGHDMGAWPKGRALECLAAMFEFLGKHLKK